jgi:LacI family transcriptional regulator
LTTIRQPLQTMGRIGADALLKKLAGEALPTLIQVEPELIIRESTAPPCDRKPNTRNRKKGPKSGTSR